MTDAMTDVVLAVHANAERTLRLKTAQLERDNATLAHVELELRHCIRQLLKLHGKPLQRGTLRDHLYSLDLVTPDG